MKAAEIEGITASGGLISNHFIALMKEERSSFPFSFPGTFNLPWDGEEGHIDQQEFDRRASSAWEDLRKRWDDFGHRLQDMDPNDARSRWTRPLLEALGYEPVATPKHIEISDRLKFRFSHKGWVAESPKPPVVHIVPPGQGLEERSTRGEPSPHDALQAYLNVHQDRWGLVTNGRFLRLIRDYHHTYNKGYVQFDLEAIFITRSYTDFRALYRMAHASRFLPAKTGDSYLEEYFKHSLAVGEKVGAGLRENVVHAIIALGNGFLDRDLLEELKGSEESCRGYYRDILKVVYRIIFLLYAEQKGMLGGRAAGHDLYLAEYSVAALRDRALGENRRDDGHFDHWLGLVSTFEMVRRGAEELGIYPYDGMLFEMDGGEADLSGRRCRNAELLEAIRYLTATEIDRTMRKISYSEISVEEIGSIYEGLLDYTPRITAGAEEIEGVSRPANSFVLDPRGSARKTTGSYYTHPDLVSELVRSALEPVLEERLTAAGPDPGRREEAILSMKVCDPACGSGAFLIAANNRLGMELAR
ncbi:hypothetical protein P0O15_11795, partial [Methanotrichaceae archaeon Mx]|nr:hypothetical protein [Candidatus Methanocrinis natronophilus]